MKFTFLITILLISNVHALNLTQEQEKNWNFNTQKLKSSHYMPLGEFMAEVTTPPEQL